MKSRPRRWAKMMGQDEVKGAGASVPGAGLLLLETPDGDVGGRCACVFLHRQCLFDVTY